MRAYELFEGVYFDFPYPIIDRKSTYTSGVPFRSWVRRPTSPVAHLYDTAIFPKRLESSALKQLLAHEDELGVEYHRNPVKGLTTIELRKVTALIDTQFRDEAAIHLTAWLHKEMDVRKLESIPSPNMPEQYWTKSMVTLWEKLHHDVHKDMLDEMRVEFAAQYFARYDEFMIQKNLGGHESLDWRTKIASVVATLRRDCAKYLTDSRGLPLWRGSSHHNQEYFHREPRPREGRQSLQDEFGYYDWVDQQMVDHGYVAHRSNSILAVGFKSIATTYGIPGVIYMIGGYDFTWHPKISDYMLTIDDLVASTRGSGNDLEGKIKNKLTPLLNTYKTNHDSSLADAILSHHEIMLTNEKGYYVVDEHMYAAIEDTLAQS